MTSNTASREAYLAKAQYWVAEAAKSAPNCSPREYALAGAAVSMAFTELAREMA